MVRRLWKWLPAVVLIPLLVWGCDRCQMIHWVGSTELDVTFVVTETDSGQPVPGAQIDVQSEGGFYEEDDKQQFQLVADEGGMAQKVCRRSMCFGTRSGLGFTDTFAVHLPWWRFRVSAAGYEPSEWVDLDVPQYIRQAKRVDPERAKLVVPMQLQKSRP